MNRLYYQFPAERMKQKKEEHKTTLITLILLLCVMYWFLRTIVNIVDDGIESGDVEYTVRRTQ